MEASTENDALMLEKVFGFSRKKTFRAYEDSANLSYIPSGKPRRTHMIDARPVPWFTRDIAAAWLIVAELRKRGLHLQMNDTMSAYRARFFTVESTADWDRQSADGIYYMFEDTAPLAICMAALVALA